MYWLTFHYWLILKAVSDSFTSLAFFFLSFGMTRAWRNTVHLTVYSHFLVSCFHCRALVWLKALQSHTWKDLTPLVFRNFLILAQLPAQICSLQERLTVPPTITAGRLLGSSRLIAKLRTHTERVSRAGQISFFGQSWMWSQQLCTIILSMEALSDNAEFKSLCFFFPELSLQI